MTLGRGYKYLAVFFLFAGVTHSAGPEFYDISPPLVTLFGGNTLNITGSNFPPLTPGSGISCKWQETMVLVGKLVSSSLIQCPVPSVFRFTTFATDTTYRLNSLSVSFDMFSDQSEEVISPYSELGLQFRPMADELAPMSVSPHQMFASFRNLVLEITWSNLPMDLPPSIPPLCRFTVVSNTGKYGHALSVRGVIVNTSTIECMAPTLGDIDSNAIAPVDVLIHISLDGAQTFSIPHTSLRFLPDIVVDTISPTIVVNAGGPWITLVGSGFITTARLACLFEQKASNTRLEAAGLKYLNQSSIVCKVPFQDPAMPLGQYRILVTIDGINYMDTGREFTVIPTPEAFSIYPTRGYFHGGTVVNVTGMFIRDDAEGTQCLFGNAPARMYRYINSTLIQCLSPACPLAVPGFPVDGDPATCTGVVSVSVIFAGTWFGGIGGTMLGKSADYEYVVRQKIISFDPWYASAWHKPFPVRVYGKGFARPFFCRWLDLPSYEAVNVVEGLIDGPEGADSYADCEAPALPEAYTPTTASGVDSLLAYVEVSCNDQDYTIERTQWLFVKPVTVSSVSPNQVWAGTPRTGGMVIHGSNFKAINQESLSCLWHYTGRDDGIFEVAPASMIDKSTLLCYPKMPADKDALFVKVEVRIAPNVESESGVGLIVVPAPVIDSVSSNGGLAGPYLGGDILRLVASNLDFADTYVVVGDSAMIPDAVTGTIRVPPASHEDLVSEKTKPITLVLERLNRLVVGQYSYTPVSVGTYYRPAIHEGVAATCRPGSFCAGMYPWNSSLGMSSGIDLQECPPGSFQDLSGGNGCTTCQAPSYCPKTGQQKPSSCPAGKVCWDRSGNDNQLTVCPIGKLCLLPEAWATPSEIPEEEDPFRILLQTRRLLQIYPDNVTAVDCPAGMVCVPGSTAVSVGSSASVLSVISALSCGLAGVYCAPGTGAPYSAEGELALSAGFYISADGASLEVCPPGFKCDGSSKTACSPGSFQNLEGSTECSPCTAGTVCPSAGLVLPELCPAGFSCSLPGRTEASYLCPAGSYCAGSVISTAPNSGALSPTLCGNGTYCSPGTSSSVIDPDNPSAPRECALGFYCQEGAVDYTGSGACPKGYYCEAGTSLPLPAPPGSYVGYEGAYTATLCAPGTYQDEYGTAECKTCPDGFECPDEGMVYPSPCAAAHYRSNNDSSFTVAENVVCHPCQEGTWHWKSQLTSSAECLLCPERYVCGRQGMTVFATKDQTDCEPKEEFGGASICYQLSQAGDCPEGYACDAGTTSFTQYNYPCEPGYFCKPLTALREMRNLLCPSGFVCKEATGSSEAYSSVCPVGWFCPEGTAGVDKPDGSMSLYNVQSSSHVNTVDSNTGAECRKCDPNNFAPPFEVDTSECPPCGVLDPSTNTTFISNSDWVSLLCPDGTTSERGGVAPDDCEQQGIILAVVNIYNRTETVVHDGIETPLWSPDREGEWISNPTASKESLLFGYPVSDTTSYVVDFLGFDPRVETLAYTSIPTRALDIVRLEFDFSNIPKYLVMATTKSAGAGVYKLLISSNKLTPGSTAWTSYLLPHTIDESDGKSLVQQKFALKLLTLTEDLNLNVSVALLDGGHYKDMHFFNDALSISVTSANRAIANTRNSFFAVVSANALNDGGYELPYNLIPSFANQPGDASLVVDLADRVNYTEESDLINTMIPGTTFWQVAGASTVAVPWLPFFSNCDYFDKHIVLWDLFEGNTQVPPEAGECYIVPDQADVEMVAPLIYDFSSGKIMFQSHSDWCEVALQCRYEDHLDFTSGSAQPWMLIDGTGSTPLFYLTRDALTFEEAGAPDFQTSIGKFDSLEGTDSLVPVMLDSSQRTGKFPRLISLKINYAQISKTEKRIVTASISFNSFDDDSARTDYLLQVSFEPMNWVQMMNTFQLEWYVYVLVFIVAGLSVVGLGIFCWMVMNAIRNVGKSARSAMPRFALWDCYNFFMMYALQGVLVSSVPFVIVTGFIKLIMLPEVGFLSTLPCTFDRGPSSTSSPLLTGIFETATCSAVRTGTCLIASGVFTLWTGSKYFVPRLPASHKEYVESASVQKLQDDGIVVLPKKDERVHTVVAWKRFHIFLTSVLICLPLMVLFAFSYSAMFGNFTVYYSVGYTMTMLMADLLFIKIAREKLAFNYFAVITDVVFFVATLSAEDLNAFVLSYLFGTYFITVQRIIAEDVIGYIYEETIPGTVRWIKTRKFVWATLLWIKKITNFIRHSPQEKGGDSDDIKVLEFTEAPPKEVVAVSKSVKEIGSLDDDIDQVAGIASRVLSLVFGPFAVLLIWIFATETQFAANYGLMLSSIPYYLMFSVLVIPFQIALELAINHAFDATRGTHIYDYMYLCMWRWKSRLTRWLLDDARLDSSLGQSAQALHHLAFSPQFYFIVIYAVYGGVFVTYGITCWISNGVPAFLDPATGLLVILTLVAQRFADAVGRWLVFYVLWKPADRAPDKAFVQSVALGLKQKELEEHEIAFKNFFFQRHREWVIEHLDKVYTPRGITKYRSQLNEIYQKVLSIRIPYLYTAPVKKPTVFSIEEPSDDKAEDFGEDEGRRGNDRMVEVPLDSDNDDGDVLLTRNAPVTYSLVQGWLEVARKRARKKQSHIKKSRQVFPGHVTVELSESSKAVIQEWIAKVRPSSQ